MVKQNCSSCLKLMAIEPVSSLLWKINDFLQAPRHPFLAHQACVWTCRCVKLTNSGHSASEGKSSRFWSACVFHTTEMELTWSGVWTPHFSRPDHLSLLRKCNSCSSQVTWLHAWSASCCKIRTCMATYLLSPKHYHVSLLLLRRQNNLSSSNSHVRTSGYMHGRWKEMKLFPDQW